MVLKAEDVLGIQACSTVTWRCRKFYRREVARNFRSRLRRAHQLILNFLLVEQNISFFSPMTLLNLSLLMIRQLVVSYVWRRC